MFRWITALNHSADPEVVVILPEPLAGQVEELLRQHRHVDAVRLTRDKTLLNLIPAVKAVDAIGRNVDPTDE